MDFNSFSFILLFFPIVILVYYFLRCNDKMTLAKGWLIVASLFFIGYADFRFYPFFIVSALINLSSGYLQVKYREQKVLKKLIVTAAVSINIILLGYFKYTRFILSNWNACMGTDYAIEGILVPIGISFWTFQQISFLVDVSKGEIQKISILDYLFYAFYFPKLVQGPITKYKVALSAFHNPEKKKFDIDMFASGLWFFTLGLAKKVLLADVLVKAVKWGYSTSFEYMTSMDALLVIVCYTLQLYFDFSGYSHMAIGLSQMLNIEVSDNFDTPFQSKSIIEFWGRWHISLTNFLKEYVYFPLGGSKKGKVRTYINTMIIFTLSGIWHGASWNYVIWGMTQGVAVCLNRMFRKQWEKLNETIRWFFTYAFFIITCVIFASPSLGYAANMLGKAFAIDNKGFSVGLLETFRIDEFSYFSSKISWINDCFTSCVGLEMVIVMAVSLFVALNVKDSTRQFKPTLGKSVLTIVMLFWSIISLSNVVEYVYEMF